MNKLLKYILSITALMLFSTGVSSQTYTQVGKNDVYVGETRLSREGRTLIIEYDLELGQGISSCIVSLLISQDGGRTFDPVTSINELEGDFGYINTSGSKRITYDIDAIKEQLAGKKIAFKVQVKEKSRKQPQKFNTRNNDGGFFIMGTASTFGMYGLRTGYVKKFGGYLSYSDSFQDGLFQQWSVTGGFMMRATPWLYPYAGVGGGHLKFDDVNYNGANGYYGLYIYDLISFEIGSMFKLGPVALSATVEPMYILPKGLYCTFEFGVGFCF